MTTINNDWYIYEKDIYGVNALFEFGSKEELMNYIVEEEFIDHRMPDGISSEGNTLLQKLTDQFRTNELSRVQYIAALEELMKKEAAEIEHFYIDNFESLCQGNTHLGKIAVKIFAERQGDGELTTVPEELKPTFKEFMDNALGDWIG